MATKEQEDLNQEEEEDPAAVVLALTVDELPAVFDDLTPIPQDDGPVAVARIDYPTDFTAAFDYFRAVITADERSERALHLTATCLTWNPANYTVWHYRRLCLQQLQYDRQPARLTAELKWVAQLGGDNPKNYQIWYHRRALLERLQVLATTAAASESDDGGSNPTLLLLVQLLHRELDYTAMVFDADSKNYHSWTYRQWVVQTLQKAWPSAHNDDDEAVDTVVWQNEVDYCNVLLQKDVRNNSAWNQRWFAVHRGRPHALSAEDAAKEIEYALAACQEDPYNESPWRYFIATVKEQVKHNPERKCQNAAEYLQKIQQVQQAVLDADQDPDNCPNLLSAKMDLLEWQGDVGSLEEAATLAQKLATTVDPIREKYWKLRCQQLEQQQQQRASLSSK